MISFKEPQNGNAVFRALVDSPETRRKVLLLAFKANQFTVLPAEDLDVFSLWDGSANRVNASTPEEAAADAFLKEQQRLQHENDVKVADLRDELLDMPVGEAVLRTVTIKDQEYNLVDYLEVQLQRIFFTQVDYRDDLGEWFKEEVIYLVD